MCVYCWERVMSLLYTKVGKLLSYHLYVFVFLLYFYKISLVYSFFTIFSRKQQKSLSYAKRLRTTTPIFVEEIRKQVKYGLLQHTFLGRTYQYDYPFFQFRKGAVAQWVVTVVGSTPACSTKNKYRGRTAASGLSEMRSTGAYFLTVDNAGSNPACSTSFYQLRSRKTYFKTAGMLH